MLKSFAKARYYIPLFQLISLALFFSPFFEFQTYIGRAWHTHSGFRLISPFDLSPNFTASADTSIKGLEMLGFAFVSLLIGFCITSLSDKYRALAGCISGLFATIGMLGYIFGISRTTLDTEAVASTSLTVWFWISFLLCVLTLLTSFMLYTDDRRANKQALSPSDRL